VVCYDSFEREGILELAVCGYLEMKVKKWLILFSFLIALDVGAFGETICSYIATSPPQNQGWEVSQAGQGVTGKLLKNAKSDEGSAWRIWDSTHENGELYYTWVFSQSDQELIAQKGWRLTILLEVEKCEVPEDNEKLSKSTSQLEVYGGENGRNTRLNFSLRSKEYGSDSYVTALSVDGTRIDNLGFGYQKFEAQAKPNQDGTFNIDLWVDGRSRYCGENLQMNGVFRGGVRWGSFGTEGTSTVKWHKIVLETLEESNELKIIGKDEQDFDYSFLEVHLGAIFDVNAPQLISNMPLGKCAEFDFEGVPLALSKPVLNNMHDFYELYFAVRNPVEYEYEDDIRISMTYDYQDNLKSITVHGDLIYRNEIPYQYFLDGSTERPLSELADLIKETLESGIENEEESDYLSVMVDFVHFSIIAVDIHLVKKQQVR